MKSKGLTLIELIIVIFILSLISAGFYFATKNLPKQRLENAATEALSAFRETQSLAISKRQNYRLDFSTSNAQYKIVEVNTSNVVKTIDCPKGIWFTSYFSDNQVEFTPSGSPDESSVIIFRNKFGLVKVINLNSVGRVTIS